MDTAVLQVLYTPGVLVLSYNNRSGKPLRAVQLPMEEYMVSGGVNTDVYFTPPAWYFRMDLQDAQSEQSPRSDIVDQ